MSKSGSFAHKQCNHWHTEQRKTTKYFRTKAFKKKSKTIILLPLKQKKKREKEGELSGRFIS